VSRSAHLAQSPRIGRSSRLGGCNTRRWCWRRSCGGGRFVVGDLHWSICALGLGQVGFSAREGRLEPTEELARARNPRNPVDAAINPGAHKSTAVVIDELFAFVRTGWEIHWSVNITQGLCLRCLGRQC